MLEGRYVFGDEDYSDAIEIRKIVFNMEQGIPLSSEVNDSDEDCIIAIAYENQKAVATGRLLFDGQIYRIGKVAVIKEYRGKSYGDFIVRMLVDKAIKFGATKINVISHINTKVFFEKIGFVESGDSFVEDSIERVPMVLNINNIKKKCSSN